MILGIVWGSWHLPLFWIPDAPDATLIQDDAVAALWVVGFILNIVELSIILTWLFNSTGGSLLLAGLFHASVGTAFQAVILLNLWGNPTVAILGLGLCGLAVIILVFVALSPRLSCRRV